MKKTLFTLIVVNATTYCLSSRGDKNKTVSSVPAQSSGTEQSTDTTSVAGSTLKGEDLWKAVFPNTESLAQQDDETPIDVSSVIPRTRKDLEDLRIVVKMYQGNDNAGMQVPGFGGLSLGRDETNLNVYYIESKIVQTGNDTSVYGVGYSAHYLFKRVKKGLNVTNLASIAASVQLDSKRTNVLYSMQTYGISGIPIVKYFRPVVNSNYDVEGYGVVQAGLNGIHNIMADSTRFRDVRYSVRKMPLIKPYDLNPETNRKAIAATKPGG